MLGLLECIRELVLLDLGVVALLDLGVVDFGGVEVGVVDFGGVAFGVVDLGGVPFGVVDFGGVPFGVVDFECLLLGLPDRLPSHEVGLLAQRERDLLGCLELGFFVKYGFCG